MRRKGRNLGRGWKTHNAQTAVVAMTSWNACGILYLWFWTHTASGSENKLWLCLYGCSHSFILTVVFVFNLVWRQIAKSLMPKLGTGGDFRHSKGLLFKVVKVLIACSPAWN